MRRIYILLLMALMAMPMMAYEVSEYDVVWNSQSDNSNGSMPLGGGDVGCNVWVEKGDLMLYISRSGAFDENNTMLKHGRMRIHFDGNPLDKDFVQRLVLDEGCILVKGSDMQIRLWVELKRPVLHIEAEGKKARKASMSFESWRTEDRQLSTRERHQCLGYSNTTPDKILVYTRKDTFKPEETTFYWGHINRNDELITDREAVQQHLGDVKDQLWNPLRNLCFGGAIRPYGMKLVGTEEGSYCDIPFTAWRYETAKAQKKHNIDVYLEVTKAASEGEFFASLHAKTADIKASAEALKVTREWWHELWQRSYIYIDMEHPGSEAWTLGRNYALMRYELACNAYGEWPSKFNGSFFTYDPGYFKKEFGRGVSTPDFRSWGGGSFTGQNQRLLYWPMLKSGDFDMMAPQFDFYNNALPNVMLFTRKYWGHGGAAYSEQINNNGLPCGHSYQRLWDGTSLPIQPRSEASSTRHLVNNKGEIVDVVDYGWITNQWVEDHHDTQLEFAKMILDYYEYSRQSIDEYMLLIDQCLRFHDEHFQYYQQILNGAPLGPDGKLVMYPGSAIETYKHATNAICTIAGMKSVIEELLRNKVLGTKEQREYWKGLLGRLPELPLREREGYMTLSPAKTWDGKVINNEVPQLYPVFPYRLYGLGRPDIQLAIDTYFHGVDKGSQRATPRATWLPDAIYAADLGLTDEAVKYVKMKLCNSSQARFPTFWGTGDWTPDLNWGGVGMIALQEMLLQAVDDKASQDGLLYFPAWPKEWDVQFRLHVPGGKVVEAEQKGGVRIK